MSAFLALDWGTTHLRGWRVEGGRPAAAITLERGVGSLAPGEAERVFFEEAAPALSGSGLPAILCGMVGSTLGWHVAPYVAAPAGLSDLAAALVEVAPGVRIVPGVRRADSADVMRGEETKALGWMSADVKHARGVHTLLMPGTHCKHVRMEDGKIADFQTMMTGELFALLRTHSTLKQPNPIWSDAAFDEGVAQGREKGIQALFQARARVVSGALPAERAESFLSGVLIGAECVHAPPAPILLGAPELTRLYARALPDAVIDGSEAALAGLIKIYEAAP
jgi:2-dehydro-3-deoxygalactonokinase